LENFSQPVPKKVFRFGQPERLQRYIFSFHPCKFYAIKISTKCSFFDTAHDKALYMKGYRTKHNAGHAGKAKADDKRVKPSDEIGILGL